MYSAKMEQLAADLAYKERLRAIEDYMYRNQDKIKHDVEIAIQFPNFYKEFNSLTQDNK